MKQTPWLLGCTSLALALGTVSCTTLGTHVKGGFACHAPQGTCAPMSNIDAQAIADLGAGNGQIDPISTNRIDGRARFITTSDKGIPVRTNERVIRVVFPAHTDGRGVFHEEAAAHLVSEPSNWTLRPADAPAIGSLDAAIIAGSPSTNPPTGMGAAIPTPGPVTSTAPLNLREAAAGLTAPADPLRDPPAEQVAIDMPGAQSDLPSAQAIAAARAGHRIGDARFAFADGKERLKASAHRPGRRKTPIRKVVATIPGAATADLNRAALRKLGVVHSPDLASAARSPGATPTPAGGLAR